MCGLLGPIDTCRGNADSLVCLLVLGVVAALVDKRYTLAAIIFGTGVHVKIYPIIYALPIVLVLEDDADPVEQPRSFGHHLARLFRWRRVKFALESAGTFFALNFLFFLMCVLDTIQLGLGSDCALLARCGKFARLIDWTGTGMNSCPRHSCTI